MHTEAIAKDCSRQAMVGANTTRCDDVLFLFCLNIGQDKGQFSDLIASVGGRCEIIPLDPKIIGAHFV